MPNELKLCPWCGNTPDVSNNATFRLTDGVKYGALQCCVTGPEVRADYKDVPHWRGRAIKAWNERITPPSTAEVELPPLPKPWCERIEEYYGQPGSKRIHDTEYFKDQEIDEWRAWGRECASGALASRPAGEVEATTAKNAAVRFDGGVELPPLPEPRAIRAGDGFPKVYALAYTADQLRAYGQECARAEYHHNIARIQHLTHERDKARADFRAALASKPTAQAARGSIDTPEFRAMIDSYVTDGTNGYAYWHAKIIAHIDAWGARLAGVPAGWKPVPIKPTIAMHNAAALAGLCGKSPEFENGRIVWAPADASAVYRAMIAAAPALTPAAIDVEEVASVIEDALVDDLLPHHSPEWVERARAAIAQLRGTQKEPPCGS